MKYSTSRDGENLAAFHGHFPQEIKGLVVRRRSDIKLRKIREASFRFEL